MVLRPGSNDVSRLAPGVCFVQWVSGNRTQQTQLTLVRWKVNLHTRDQGRGLPHPCGFLRLSCLVPARHPTRTTQQGHSNECPCCTLQSGLHRERRFPTHHIT